MSSSRSSGTAAGHFFAAAAEAMRRILVEDAAPQGPPEARRRSRTVDLDETAPLSREPAADELLALDEALAGSAKPTRKAKLVELRYFAGLTIRRSAAR